MREIPERASDLKEEEKHDHYYRTYK